MAFPSVVYTANSSAASGLVSNAAAAGLDLSGLNPLAQLQSAVANLLLGDPTTVVAPAGDVASGTFGANLTPADTGTYAFPGVVTVAGNFSVATSKFTVASASGNTVIAGTAAIQGVSLTLSLAGAAFAIQGTTTALTANVASGAITVKGNVGTGTGAVGGIIFQIPVTHGSDSVAQTLTTVLTLSATTVVAATFAGALAITGALTGVTTLTMAGALTGVTTLDVSTSATITSSSAVALAVGLAGATNPAFLVNSSTGSQAAGLSVTGAVAAGTVAVAVISSGAAANLTLNALGTGTIGIGSVSTGIVTITPATTISGATIINNTVQLGTAAGANLITIGGTGYGAGVASVRFNGLTTAAVTNQTATLLNAPVAGNPNFWLPISIAGVIRYLAAW